MSNLSVYEQTPANPRAAIATLKDLLEKSKGKLGEVAAKHLSADRMARIAILAVSGSKLLMECKPTSILACLMTAASLGLEVGGSLGDAYLVPFRQKDGSYVATLIIGYRGLISLARRSGQILSIEADVVREKDSWTFRKNQDGTFFEHAPSEEENPGEIKRGYAIARLRDTPVPAVIVMTKREIDAIRASSKAGQHGPWKEHYPEMMKKTLIRRLTKMLPMSVEFADAIDKEDRAEAVPSAGAEEFVDFSQSGDTVEQATVVDIKPKSPLDSLVKPPKAKEPEAAPLECTECGMTDSHQPGCPMVTK